MQFQFLLYHYFNTKEVYNLIRVYIGAYVFLTGFGNFRYFSSPKAMAATASSSVVR